MSVVNKMLRDLESREQMPSIGANYVPSRSNKLWLFVAVILVLISITAISSVYIAVNTHADSPRSPEKPSSHDKQPLRLEEGDQIARTGSIVESVQNSEADISAKLPSSLTTTKTAQVIEPTTALADHKQEKLSPDSNPITGQPNLAQASKNRSVFKVNPSDGAKASLSSLRAQAHMAAEENNDDKVVTLLNEILSLAPEEHRTRKQLAALYFSKKRFQEAQFTLEQGLALAPAESSLRLMLSRIFFKAGDNVNAFSILSDHPYPNMASDEFVSFRAALAEKIGKYDSAQSDYQLLVQRNPNDAKWWLGLGVSQDKQKKAEQALSSYQHAQSLNQLPQQVESFVAQRIQLLAGQF